MFFHTKKPAICRLLIFYTTLNIALFYEVVSLKISNNNLNITNSTKQH